MTKITEKKASAAAKRGAKNSVFCDLFGIPEYTLELYKVLHPEDETVTVDDIGAADLRNVLVDRMYNDLGFRVRDKLLIMIEAQSTWSVNILVRILLYLAETWKEHIRATKQYQYGTRKLSLPWPEFYVLYTGDEDVKEEYSLAEEYFGGESDSIDLRIRVLRKGMTDTDIISQYVRFTRVFDSEVKKTGYTQETILKVIEICKNEDILKEYLEDREKEVYDIMKELFDPEELIHAYGIYERNEGRNEGRAEGKLGILFELVDDGKLPLEEAAQKAEMTVEAFLKEKSLQPVH